MAKFHARSNSFPSQSHPVFECVEDNLCRLKSSQAASTSAADICSNLAAIKDLHEGINSLIQMPSIQRALSHGKGENWMNQLLEGSLRVMDLCGVSREVVFLTKGCVQDLKSSIRRNKGEKATSVGFDAYATSRKKISKMCVKNLKGCNQISTPLPDEDSDLKAIRTMLKEAEAVDLSVLKSVLTALSGEKERSGPRRWSLLSKFVIQIRHAHSEEDGDADFCSLNIHKFQKGTDLDSITLQSTLMQLNASEMFIQELEDGLESLFRSLVKTRASLLNVLSY